LETLTQNPKQRSYEALACELKRVSNKGSTAFWAFWDGMTLDEKRVLLHGEDVGPIGQRR